MYKYHLLFRVITYALLIVLVLLVFGAFLFIPFLQNELYIKRNIDAENLELKNSGTKDSKSDLYESVLRFHVRANSDSEADQAVKQKVRDAVLDKIKQDGVGESREAVMNYIKKQKESLIAVANQVLRDEGFGYVATAYLTKENFPVKQYGDLTFPAGEYDAFRVDLGCAQGHNWWCVLYPSLCFVDTTSGVVPEESKEELKAILPKEEYEDLLFDSDTKIEFHSKLWDVVSNWF